MISQQQFIEAFAILEDRFNRELSAPTISAYHSILSEELTVEEFQQACRECFRRDTFFPAPQRLIDLARGGSEEEQAEQAWHAVQEVLGGTERLDWSAMSAPLKAALRVASPGAIMEASAAQLHQLRKDFVRTYVAAARGGTAVRVPTLEPVEHPLAEGVARTV